MALPRLGNTRHDAALARAIQQEEDAELARELSHGGQRAAPPAPRGQARQGVNCPRGCGLKRFTATSAQRIVCDVCSSRIAPGRPALSCLRCDFDVCEDCARPSPAERPRPRPRRSPAAADPYARSAGVDVGMALVSCRLGNAQKVDMMVDTGAQHSVISADLARALGILDRLDASEQGVAAGVGRARILGKLRGVAVTLDAGVEFALDFSVLDVQDQLLLLGLDQMRRFRCIVDLEKNCLIFGGAGGVNVPFLPPDVAQRRRERLLESLPPDVGCRPM